MDRRDIDSDALRTLDLLRRLYAELLAHTDGDEAMVQAQLRDFIQQVVLREYCRLRGVSVRNDREPREG